MKTIKDNKGIIIFFIIVIALSLVWCNHVEKTNDQMNNIQERS